MAITSYSTLQTEILNWLDRSDLSNDIQTFISLGESRIYRELRIRQMETSFATAITNGVISIPDGYLELESSRINTSPVHQLTRTSKEDIYLRYPFRSKCGKPNLIAREANNFIFGPYPDSDYQVTGVYYKRLDSLSTSNTTNWLITDAPDLILYASLAEAYGFIDNEKELTKWGAFYDSAKNRIESSDKMERYSGSSLRVSLGKSLP